METLYSCILGYGHGFHGPVQLLLSKDKHLQLFVHGKIVYSSDWDNRSPVYNVIDGTDWAESAFQ